MSFGGAMATFAIGVGGVFVGMEPRSVPGHDLGRQAQHARAVRMKTSRVVVCTGRRPVRPPPTRDA